MLNNNHPSIVHCACIVIVRQQYNLGVSKIVSLSSPGIGIVCLMCVGYDTGT